ncbi:MAG TPA: CerR family C-terminal domain-containing protein [Halomonas sp.]|nr:CerR family C-terminal domain-containing protein [Halomonas sp.]
MSHPSQRSSCDSSQHTRQRLIEAGIRLFGEQGFSATTTRQLAEAASANIGSIAYHFGNKHGLYLAAAGYIAAALRQRLGLFPPPIDEATLPMDTADARRALQAFVQHMVRVFTEDPDCRRWMLMVMREQAQPGAAFDILYDDAFGHLQKRVSALIARIIDRPQESRRVIVETHTLVGQVLFLLIGREALLRRLGLTDFDADTLADIDAVIERHLNRL